VRERVRERRIQTQEETTDQNSKTLELQTYLLGCKTEPSTAAAASDHHQQQRDFNRNQYQLKFKR